jgi:hypothetical protein
MNPSRILALTLVPLAAAVGASADNCINNPLATKQHTTNNGYICCEVGESEACDPDPNYTPPPPVVTPAPLNCVGPLLDPGCPGYQPPVTTPPPDKPKPKAKPKDQVSNPKPKDKPKPQPDQPANPPQAPADPCPDNTVTPPTDGKIQCIEMDSDDTEAADLSALDKCNESTASSLRDSDWGDSNPKNCGMWDYIAAVATIGLNKLSETPKVKNASGKDLNEKIKKGWKGLGSDRYAYATQDLAMVKADKAKFDAVKAAYKKAGDACSNISTDQSEGKLQAFVDASGKFEDARKAFYAVDQNGAKAPADSAPHRLAAGHLPSDKVDLVKATCIYRNDIQYWQASIKAAAEAQAVKAKAGAADNQKAADDFTAKQAGFRAKMDGGKGQGDAVAGELTAAFDRVGITGAKGLHVEKRAVGNDGTVMLDVNISAEDYSKLSDDQKKRLDALGIKPGPVTDRKNTYTIPGATTKGSLDAFEKVLFADPGSYSLKVNMAKDAASEASAADFVKKTVGGTSVAKLAEDAHSREELDEKIKAARSKASADYLSDDQKAVKACLGMKEDDTPTPQMLKYVNSGADPKCVEARRQALATYKAKQDALDMKQGDGDQARAMVADTNFGAYKAVITQKMQRDAYAVSSVATDYNYQKCHPQAAAGPAKANVAKQAKALDDSLKPEFKALDAASAKLKDVQAGKATLSDVRAIGDVVSQALDMENADDLYKKRHGGMEDTLNKLLQDFDPSACVSFGANYGG